MTISIICRVDGTATCGMGHVSRCVSLLVFVKKHHPGSHVLMLTSPSVSENARGVMQSIPDAEIVEIPSTETMETEIVHVQELLRERALPPTGIMLLDGYQFEQEYFSELRRILDDVGQWSLVYIDDNCDRTFDGVDYILNHNAFASDMESMYARASEIKHEVKASTLRTQGRASIRAR